MAESKAADATKAAGTVRSRSRTHSPFGASSSSSDAILKPQTPEREEAERTPPDVPLSRAVCILVTCIALIGLLASLIIMFCSDLARSLGVDQSTLGYRYFYSQESSANV